MADIEQLTIDPDFESLGRKLTPEEDSLLEASLEVNGCIDPIVTWAGHDDTILDGHNRYRKCVKFGIKFKRHPLKLEPRDAAREWIINHQLGKRNCTDEQKSYLRGLKYRDEKQQGKRTDLTCAHDAHKSTAAKLAEEHGVDPATVRRDAAFSEAVDTLAETVPEIKDEILSGTSGMTKKAIVEAAAAPPDERADAITKARCHVANNSGNNEWYTPAIYLEAAREVLGTIDLDPASAPVAQRLVKAAKFYTADDDGLRKKWKGRVWLNPPYSGDLVGQFTSKLLSHVESGDVTAAVVLVNNATDTKWFQAAASASSAVCFTAGRIKYLDSTGEPKNTPVQGQAFLYFGDAASKFADVFQQFGFCAEVCADA